MKHLYFKSSIINSGRTMKLAGTIILLCLLTVSTPAWGAGTTAKTISAGDQYFSAYKEAKTNLSTNNWVSTSGSPGDNSSSYTAPSGWLDGGSGKPGVGCMNVQSGKTVIFTVTNITGVSILGCSNNTSSRTINLSVKTGGVEVGTVATKTTSSTSSPEVLDYGSTLDKTKTYTITVSASDGNNAKFMQIKFVGAEACAAAPTAPTGLSAGTLTRNGATFTITDGANTNNYEIVCKTISGTPAADATPTATGTSKTIVVNTLSPSTTYYAWVRSVCDESYKSSWVALGTTTFTTEDCPASGTIYELTVKSASYSVPATTETNMVSDYATVTGGGAYIGNTDGSAGKAQVTTTGDGTVLFNGAKGYVKLVLDCPIQTGDQVTFVNGYGTNQICFSTTNSQNTSNTTASNTYTFPAAFNNVSTIYVWRTSGSSTYMHSLTITRSAACTPPGKATSFSKSSATTSSVTLGWTPGANVDSQYVYLYTDAACTSLASTTEDNPQKILGTATSATFNGICPSANYYATVRSLGNGTTYCKNDVAARYCDTITAATSAGTIYTITWMVNGEEYTTGTPTTSTNDCLGITTMPTAPADNTLSGCANSFRGWSETNLYGAAGQSAPADLFRTAAEAPTIDKNKTFYAVFGTGTDAAYVNTVLWSEDWTGATTATSASDAAKPSAQGSHSGKVVYTGSVTYTQTSNGTYVRNENTGGGSKPELMIKAKEVWTVSGIALSGAKTVNVSYLKNPNTLEVAYYLDGDSISANKVTTATSGSFDINCSGKSTLLLTFRATTTSAVRIDDIVVKVKSDGATNCRCICPSLEITPKLITASTPIFITSAAEKTVRSQDSLLIVGSGLQKGATLSISSPASKFVLKSRTYGALTTDATGSIDAVGYIYYTPDAVDTSDGLDKNASFTISDGTNTNTVSTALIGRHLPANFVIAAKNGDTWYALPADTASGKPAPVKLTVDNATTPTSAAAHDSIIYSLYGQLDTVITKGNGHTTRLEMHGIAPTGGSGHAPLFGSTDYDLGRSGNSTLSGKLGTSYWWIFTQTNTSVSATTDVKYTVKVANGNTKPITLYNNAEKWGLYASGSKNVQEIRLIPACTVSPAEPSISGETDYTAGDEIELTATCSSGTDASTTYTWYKGADWATASASSPVQAASTSGATFTKASCVVGDAGTYWCEAANGACAEHNETGYTITIAEGDCTPKTLAGIEVKDDNEGQNATGDSIAAEGGYKVNLESTNATHGGKTGYKIGSSKYVYLNLASNRYFRDGDTAYVYLTKLSDQGDKGLHIFTGTTSAGTEVATVASPALGWNKAVLSDVPGGKSQSLTVHRSSSTTEQNHYIFAFKVIRPCPTDGYSITYHCNEATSGCPSNATEQTTLPNPLATPTKTNYTFGGWYTDAALSSAAVAGATLSANADLYVKWTQTVTLNTGSQGSGAAKTPTVVWQATALTGFSAHTADGYTLQGYYTAGSGGVKVLNADGTFAGSNVTDYITSSKWSRTGAAPTLYAQWVEAAAPTLYTVTFNSNGGSAQASITQASEDASITMPAAPTYSGYTFQGWVIGGTTYAAGASYTPTANVTAYASWKADCAGGGGGGTTLFSATHTSSSTMSASTGSVTLSSTSSEQVNNGIKFSGDGGYIEATGTSSFATGDVITVRVYNASSSTADRGFKLHNTSGTAHTASIGATSTADIEYTLAAADIESNGKLRILRSNSNVRIQSVTVVRPAGTCFYVTYNGNGAEAGCISDATAYAASDEVTVSSNTGASAFTKSGYHVGSWNTAANGSGTTYALGATFNISADVTLHAQWVLDACSAPSAPTISGTSVRTVGQTITLNAACATGADASTTYTWYKGATWETKSQVQAALTAGEGGRIFNKASCVAGDAGTYWCEASNGDGCESHNATGFTVTVNDAAGDEHIYYYKDADHYSDDTYSNPEGNTAASGDNKSLSSPWMICNGCMTGVDSVVAHGATYDGKGNHMNAYIKLPTGGDATTKNIKFALTAGYTGTLTMKIGGYENNPTVTLQPLTAGVLDIAITPTSGTVGGVATTEDDFNPIVWPLSTAGGTYVLTVTTKTGYISQIDMTTTATAASFNVTYNGNGNTGGNVPTDATNYTPGATVTVAANTGDGKLVKTNYTGAGWNTANNGTGTNYVPGSGTFTITANTTLYAHWTQLITLAPGAQGTGTNNAAVSWNGSVLRGFAAHTASGYALQGYYTEPSGGTKVLNADGSFAATNIDGFVTSGKWSNTGAAPTLYAQWEASSLLKWNLKVNVSETSITTLSKESAAPTVIAVANMGNLTNNGSLTITGSAKSALTSKIEAPTSYDANKYMSVQFVVAAGYQLRPSDINVKVQPVDGSCSAKLVLEDNNSVSMEKEQTGISKGSTVTVTMTNTSDKTFTGTVTLKIYVYGSSTGTYRLGTPIEINGSVEATCTPPTFSGISYSATEYMVDASASAISVTGAANVDSYQWKYNAVNDRTSGTDCGTGASVTPSTESTGTLYYWCELTNTCTTVKTAAVGITVRNATTDPSVAWSNVKLGATDDVTPNYGGGNYVLRATVNETSWPGTLAASMITAPAGIRIHHVTTGKADNKNYIEFKFDVTTAFDRASNATIDFNIALPEAGSYSALNSVKSVTYNDCSGGAAGQVAIKMGATASTSKSNPQNYWETAGAGRLMYNYGSNMGSTNNSSGYKTADSTFYYYAASTGQKWMFQTYIAGVNKVRVAFRAAGTIKSSKATITNFYYNTEYFASPGSNAVSFGDVNANKAGYSSGEDGYIEFTVPEMAANSYGAFVTADGNMKVYGVVLYTENAGGGGSVATNPAWSDSKEDGFTVEKNQSDANFTYTISTTTNTLGAITYSSNNPSVAAVNATTGEVTITATGTEAQSAVITATLARSGCYKGATRTYTINVAGYSCSEPSGSVELTTGSATKCASESVTLTMTGFTEGASIQWYNGDSPISNGGGYGIETTATQSTLTTTAAGTYSAIATNSCAAKRTNSITIANMDMSEQKTVRKVSQWYVKNGRLTPDIALWQLGEGETFKSVAWSPANATGLDFVTRSGIVYLEGKEPSTNTSGADIPYTLTLTITDACGTDHALEEQTIKLTHQKNTDKHVLAFVVNGTAKGGFTEGITAAQTTSVGLYNAIAAQFDVQATNIYSTDDEQKLKEYYSQYDILCITDYPNTQTKGVNSKSYVDAIGALIDIRPILTMEAFVSSLSNWKLKGVSGSPKSPSTRQYTMLLQCKDHEIFSGTTLTKVGEGEDAMYRVTMVDKSQEEYKTLDANYGDGEHKSNEGYQYGKKPALQGFTYTEEMSDNDMLPLGLIDDGAGNDLQVGIERQKEMSARMMVLGINSYAMERLDGDGEAIVINALKYLMKKSAEDISDCSVYFDGSDETDPTNWDNELNWGPSYASLPLPHQEVRILKECVVKDGVVARASGIKIIPRGRINHDTDDASGSLTIEPGGALIVDGKVRAAVAPNYFNATPTTPSNLVLQSNSSAQAALILDNSEGETQATVNIYSKANKDGSTRNWQYLAIPIQEAAVSEFFYGVGTYTYKHIEAQGGWVRYGLGTTLEAFDGIGLTQVETQTLTFYGPLADTDNHIYYPTYENAKSPTKQGTNIVGNSWTAPINLLALEETLASDATNLDLDIAIYNTGKDKKTDGSWDTPASSTEAGTWEHVPLTAAGVFKDDWAGATHIPAYQAFQIKATSADAMLNIDYERCVRNNFVQEKANIPLRAPSRRGAHGADRQLLRLAVQDTIGIDYIYLIEGPEFTEGYDNGWEAAYSKGITFGKLYALDAEANKKMTLARPDLEGTMVGFVPGVSKTYTITFNQTEGYYYLNDLKTEESTLIQKGNSYTFTWEDGDAPERFMISGTPFIKTTPTGVDEMENGKWKMDNCRKVIYNDHIYIIRGGRIYGVDGATIK